MRDWLTKSEDLHVLFYEVRALLLSLHTVLYVEDLVKAPLQEVRKVLRHLNFEAEDRRLACLERLSEGNMKRQEARVANPFSQHQQQYINRIIRVISRLLQRKKQLSLKNYIAL